METTIVENNNNEFVLIISPNGDGSFSMNFLANRIELNQLKIQIEQALEDN